jgi:demethylmenaquinone methyltransferase/2-methoxy-6-polyprenyl-1,4-benzoquinol methylase
MKQDQKIPTRDHVAQMFDAISRGYDRTNRILSFGSDPWFRKALSKTIPQHKSVHLLDVATGTCDQILCNFRERSNIEKVTGIDISKDMLKVGLKKIFKSGLGKQVHLLIDDAEKSCLYDETFDVATLSFGIRNFKDPFAGLKEIHRLLKKEGSVHILEFSVPKNWAFKRMFLFYLKWILPFVGACFTSNLNAYNYLNQSIQTFAQREDLCSIMQQAGFQDVNYKSLFFGIITIYLGKKL